MVAVILSPLISAAQEEKLDTKKGNEQYRSGRYDEAISEYTEALKKNPDYAQALFNTGNALLEKSRRLFEKADAMQDPNEKKKMMEEAKQVSEKAATQYAAVANSSKTREEKNKSNYNLGNARLYGGEFEKSIEAYKEALRNDPADDDARYNLAYAQHLLERNKNQSQQNKQDRDQQQNQDKKDQKDQKDQQDQQQDQNQQDKEQNEQQQPQQPEELTQEEADKLLQTLSRQEKDLQEELKKNKHKAVRVKIEKDW